MPRITFLASAITVALAAFVAAGPASAQQKLTLRIGAGNPVGPVEYTNAAARQFMPEVTKRAKEEAGVDVTWIEAWGGTAAKLPEMLEATQSGLIDVGVQLFLFEPSNLFLHNLNYYVPFNSPDPAVVTAVTRKVFEAHPVMAQTLEGRFKQKLLGLNSLDNYNICTTFEWNSVEQLKGRKIGAGGPNLPLLKPLGIVGVQTSFGEGYNNIKSGVYEGYLAPLSAVNGFKFYEVCPHVKVIDMGAVVLGGLTMNIASFNKLPPKLQQIVVEAGANYEKTVAANTLARQQASLDAITKAGAKVSTLSPAERAKWAQALANLPREMAAEGDKRGLPGSKAIGDYLRLLKEAGHQTPVDYKLN